MRRLMLSVMLVFFLLPMGMVHAESWTCQSATCTARIIEGGTTTTVTLNRDGELIPGSGATIILDTGSWHHNP